MPAAEHRRVRGAIANVAAAVCGASACGMVADWPKANDGGALSSLPQATVLLAVSAALFFSAAERRRAALISAWVSILASAFLLAQWLVTTPAPASAVEYRFWPAVPLLTSAVAVAMLLVASRRPHAHALAGALAVVLCAPVATFVLSIGGFALRAEWVSVIQVPMWPATGLLAAGIGCVALAGRRTLDERVLAFWTPAAIGILIALLAVSLSESFRAQERRQLARALDAVSARVSSEVLLEINKRRGTADLPGEISAWLGGLARQGELSHFAIRLDSPSGVVYGRTVAPGRPEWSREQLIVSAGLRWGLRMWPDGSWLARYRSPLPSLVLGLGLAAAFMIACLVRLAYSTARWSSQTQAVNCELNHTIAQLQRAEDELRRSEQRFLASVENMLDGFSVCSAVRDSAGRIVDFTLEYVNEAACRRNGMTQDQLVGGRLLRIRPKHPDASLFSDYCNVVETGERIDRECVEYVNRDQSQGIDAAYEVRAARLADGFVTASIDITARVRAEEARQQFEARYAALFEGVPAGVYRTSPGGQILDANPALARILGYSSPDALRGVNAFGLYVDPFDRAGMQRRLADEGSLVAEIRLRRQDGSPIWVRDTCRALYNEAGEVRLYEGVLEDITGRKEAEEQLARQAEELARSNAELERFAYVASHDLQEPLRMVRSFTELLAERYRGKLDADADDFIHFIVDGATRMQRLIEDLLAYARISTKARPLEPVDCNSVVRQALENVGGRIRETHAVVTHDRLPVVAADGRQLIQLFQNLLSNALKFQSGEVPRVHVGVRADADRWTFSVRDNGIGIPPEGRERIFNIFERGGAGREHPGTGIGLAIAKRIVERHGGRIWADSAPGEGAVFFFTIANRAGGETNEGTAAIAGSAG